MEVAVVRPSELGPEELSMWRGLQSAHPMWANPFLSPEFTEAVGRVRPSTRVAVLSEGQRTVGFFPFERHPLGHGGPVGGWLNDCQGLVYEPELEWDPRNLIRRCGLAVWEFDHLVSGHKRMEPYTTRWAPSPVIDLTDGFEAYLATRDRSRIRDVPRRLRRLAREVGEVRFVYDSDDLAALRTVIGWKSAQYRRTGRADRFAHPWIVALVEDLLAVRTYEFAGMLSLLYAGEQLVAGHLGLRSASVLPTWFPSYDTRFRRHSPGLLLHLELAKAAAAAGIDQIDLGRGSKDYKEELKSGDLHVAEGRVVRRVPAAALHGVRRAPARWLRNVVVGNPRLFRVADRVLKAGGGARDVARRAIGPISEETT
jgi:CelD/BcsL family acetyltransferase involved in cellulose biosynthesis